MELFLCVFTDIIHFLKIIITCDLFFSFQKRDLKHIKMVWAIAMLSVGCVSATIYIHDNHILETFLYIAVMMIIIYILYQEKILNVIFITISILFTLSMIDVLTYSLFDVVTKLSSISGENIVNFASSVFSILIVGFVGKIYQKYISSSKKNIRYINMIGFIFLLITEVFVVSAIVTQPIMDSDMLHARNLYLIAVVFVIIGIFIQLATVIILFTQRNIHKEKEQFLNAYLKEQQNHYEYLENREKETKKFRHDLRNHMELISNLAQNAEYDKIDEYLEQINMRIDTFGTIVTVHNGIVDAIINQYYMKAKENGVDMKVEGKIPVDCAIETYDLCTIFSNVLSNAYEAAVKTEEKYISLTCGYTERNIIITVENSCCKDTAGGGFWKTKKENTDYHGYGLENIKDSVRRYDGIFDIEMKDNMCILKILFSHSGDSKVETVENGYENSDCR